ncbi:hypothetical protein H0H93_002028, partial [Arthromyces matolae]
LDAFGPLDALNTLAASTPGLTISLIASTLDPVSTVPPSNQFDNPMISSLGFGQSVVPTHTFATAPPLDILIIPGGRGLRVIDTPDGNLDTNPVQQAIKFTKDVYPSLKYLITVCTGAVVAARAGVLNGKRATTNKRSWVWVMSAIPQDIVNQIQWVSKARWVNDGNVWTSSGISAGIDVTFAWILSVFGEDVANDVANVLEYERHLDPSWDPFAALYGLDNSNPNTQPTPPAANTQPPASQPSTADTQPSATDSQPPAADIQPPNADSQPASDNATAINVPRNPSVPNEGLSATSTVAVDLDANNAAELQLPERASLVIVIFANVLLQISFFIIVSSSNEYAIHLGGTSTFSGIVIGIPTVFSGLSLIPLSKYDQGVYTVPLHVACCASILGHVFYALAYYADFLYLILIGRIISGLSFTFWMYCKRYCTDPRIVGVRRRTTLASWLVVGQGIGMSLGPFVGGLLYKVGFGGGKSGRIWNGYTAPAWVMAAVWVVFWGIAWKYFTDIPIDQRSFEPQAASEPQVNVDAIALQEIQSSSAPQVSRRGLLFRPTNQQWGLLLCMCWLSMTCFFVLGAWESNIPVFGASGSPFHWSPFAAGNFLALGGASSFPFLALNIILARRTQDRLILLLGVTLGFCALITFLGLLSTGEKALQYGAVFVCWWAVALGFNLASTVTMSTLSKKLPPRWNGPTSLAIQYSNYTGRVTGAIWGGSGVAVGMRNYIGLQIGEVRHTARLLHEDHNLSCWPEQVLQNSFADSPLILPPRTWIMKFIDGASVIVCLLIASSAIEALPFAPIAPIDREIATRAENPPVAGLLRTSQGLHGRDVDIIKRRAVVDRTPTPPGSGHHPPPGFGRPPPLPLGLELSTPPHSPLPGQLESPPGSAISIPDNWPLPNAVQFATLSPVAQGLFANHGSHPQENHQPGTQTHHPDDLSLANLSPVAQGLFANHMHPSHPQGHQQPVASLANLPPITDALFGNTVHPPPSHQAAGVSGGRSQAAAPAAGHEGHRATPPRDEQSSTSPSHHGGQNGGS